MSCVVSMHTFQFWCTISCSKFQIIAPNSGVVELDDKLHSLEAFDAPLHLELNRLYIFKNRPVEMGK